MWRWLQQLPLVLVVMAVVAPLAVVMSDQNPITFPEDTHVPLKQDSTFLPQNLDDLPFQELQALNNMSSIEDFARMFNLVLPEENKMIMADTHFGGPFSFTHFGGPISLRKTVILDSSESEPVRAEMANCQPELQTVPLTLPNEPGVAYYPTCTRLMRCGGCCFGSVLECQPTQTQDVVLQVLSIPPKKSGSSRKRQANPSYLDVSQVNHTACSCQCKVKQEHCDLDIHDYVTGDCACVCKDRSKKAQCQDKPSTHMWDKDTCSCLCRRTQECSSDELFDHTHCSCQQDSTPTFL